MPIALIISILKKIGESLLAALFTEKVAMKLIIVLLKKLIKSDKTGPALDEALEIVKKELEERNK